MTSPFSFVHSLKELFAGKLKQFMVDIDDVHGVWLTEIKQEADRMLTSDFSAEPELMPKTPSQKRNNRRKRVSLGYQEETRVKRRFSKGKRSKLRGSCVKPLDLLAEDEGEPQASTSGQVIEQPKRSTRRKKQTQPEVSLEAAAVSDGSAEQVPKEEPEVVEMEMETAVPNTEIDIDADEPQASFSNTTPSPPKVPALKVSVKISSADRRSAELVAELEASPGRNATKIAIAHTPTRAERSSVRHSLKLRYSKAGLRHSMTQDAVRRASRRSILKKKSTRAGNTTCSSNASDNSCMETDGEVENNRELPSVQSDAVEESEAIPETAERKPGNWNERVTRSMAVNSPLLLVSPALTSKFKEGTMGISSDSAKKAFEGICRASRNGKRKSSDTQEASSTKKPLPPKKSQSVRPNMRAFLQTVQKNQMLMMTPTTEGRNTGMKSFIKHTTPLRIDAMDLKNGLVARERLKLEALRKKQEQEEERMKKMDEEKKRKLEEQKRKRDERLKRVVEARMKEDEEKKKRMEQKMSQTDEKNDKRMAEEKAKKKVAVKRQEEVDQKRRLEEEARLKKIQQAEEEKRQQELVAKRAAEEEDRARKLAEARRALELRREREQEKERQRQAVAERELAEREKALALQRELERAAREKERREKERRELEEKRQLEERRREEQLRLAAEDAAREREAAMQKMAASSVAVNNSSVLQTPVRKGAALNITVEVEKSPQSYSITPKGGNQPLVKSTNADDYGMDQRSDDSTDDESAPRKPIPSWAEGHNLQQAITRQYFNPPDLHAYFGTCEPPRLENIFYKSKPRYFKRTSSAVWHSPPRHGHY